MIQKISFQNYKAFEKGEIKLKPITILLGANSVGKSSIINLLSMLQQTANSTNYRSALRLHGENVSMGECRNIFRNKKTSNNIVVAFEFNSKSLKELLKERSFSIFINQIFRQIQFISRFPEKIKHPIDDEFNQFIKTGKIDKKLYNSKQAFQKLIVAIETINKSMLENKKLKKVEQPNLSRYSLRYNENFILNNKKILELIYDFFVEAKKINEDLFNLSFELCSVTSNKEDVLKIRNVSLMNNEKEILNIKFTLDQSKIKCKKINITSDFTNRQELLDNKAKDEFLKLIDFDSTIFSWVYNNKNRDFYFRSLYNDEYSIVTKTLIQIIEQVIDEARWQFDKRFINHVSPLRAHPKRYYFLDKANIRTALDSLDGDSLTEILKENVIVKNKVNTWLKTFGLQVEVDPLQDIVHKLKIKQYTLDLDITDVGFGISQILPIIVQGFLSSDNSLTMIEQPEIHLHPKMQAELADLFIDIAGIAIKNKDKLSIPKKHLLIETHSEYLLRRLRRRISEGEISAQDVAIYFIVPPKNENSSAEIQEKKVSENGFFEWPQDFYAKELIEDTTEFLKQSIRKK